MKTGLLIGMVLFFGMQATAATKPPRRVVDGVAVIPGAAFVPKPLVDIKSLKFVSCTLAETGAPCTVMSGTMVSHLPDANYVVIISAELFSQKISTFSKRGDSTFAIGQTISARVKQPAPNRPVDFTALAGLVNRPADASEPVYYRLTIEPCKYDPLENKP